MTVETIPSIEEMTGAQRVELMEELWKVMSRHSEEVEPPDWHLKVLEERDRALANGETEFIDWEEAKEYINSKTIGNQK